MQGLKIIFDYTVGSARETYLVREKYDHAIQYLAVHDQSG